MPVTVTTDLVAKLIGQPSGSRTIQPQSSINAAANGQELLVAVGPGDLVVNVPINIGNLTRVIVIPPVGNGALLELRPALGVPGIPIAPADWLTFVVNTAVATSFVLHSGVAVVGVTLIFP